MLERGFRVSPGFLTQVALTAQYVSKPIGLRQNMLKQHLLEQ